MRHPVRTDHQLGRFGRRQHHRLAPGVLQQSRLQVLQIVQWVRRQKGAEITAGVGGSIGVVGQDRHEHHQAERHRHGHRHDRRMPGPLLIRAHGTPLPPSPERAQRIDERHGEQQRSQHEQDQLEPVREAQHLDDRRRQPERRIACGAVDLSDESGQRGDGAVKGGEPGRVSVPDRRPDGEDHVDVEDAEQLTLRPAREERSAHGRHRERDEYQDHVRDVRHARNFREVVAVVDLVHDAGQVPRQDVHQRHGRIPDEVVVTRNGLRQVRNPAQRNEFDEQRVRGEGEQPEAGHGPHALHRRRGVPPGQHGSDPSDPPRP